MDRVFRRTVFDDSNLVFNSFDPVNASCDFLSQLLHVIGRYSSGQSAMCFVAVAVYFVQLSSTALTEALMKQILQ